MPKAFQITGKARERFHEIVAVSQAYVPPHFGRTECNARRIAKSDGADRCLLLRIFWPEHKIHQFRRDDMRKMAGTANEFVVRLGRHYSGNATNTRPEL